MMHVPQTADAPHAHQVAGGQARQRLARELGLTDRFGLDQTAQRLECGRDRLAFQRAALFRRPSYAQTVIRVVLSTPTIQP